MYREGRRRAWRPNPSCTTCNHGLGMHHRFGKCNFSSLSDPLKFCICSKFRDAKREANYKAAKERLKDKHFDSGLERNVAIDLERQKLAGLIAEIRTHFPMDLFVNGRKICRHYVDFRVEYSDGRIELIEAKGRKEPMYLMKRNLLEATYLLENPDVGYRVLK